MQLPWEKVLKFIFEVRLIVLLAGSCTWPAVCSTAVAVHPESVQRLWTLTYSLHTARVHSHGGQTTPNLHVTLLSEGRCLWPACLLVSPRNPSMAIPNSAGTFNAGQLHFCQQVSEWADLIQVLLCPPINVTFSAAAMSEECEVCSENSHSSLFLFLCPSEARSRFVLRVDVLMRISISTPNTNLERACS